jgi:hypothetical protein
MLTIDTANRIALDGKQTGLAVNQQAKGTMVYTPEELGKKYAEQVMPHARYVLSHAAPLDGRPGHVQFEADLRALLAGMGR